MYVKTGDDLEPVCVISLLQTLVYMMSHDNSYYSCFSYHYVLKKYCQAVDQIYIVFDISVYV